MGESRGADVLELASRVSGGWPQEVRREVLSANLDSALQKLRTYSAKARSKYHVVGHQIGRMGKPVEDFKIATTTERLARKRGTVTPFSDECSELAYIVIQGYGGRPLGKFLFALPRCADLVARGEKAIVAEEFLMDTYGGMEAVLFELWDELPEGGLITDSSVERKLLSIVGG